MDFSPAYLILVVSRLSLEVELSILDTAPATPAQHQESNQLISYINSHIWCFERSDDKKKENRGRT